MAQAKRNDDEVVTIEGTYNECLEHMGKVLAEHDDGVRRVVAFTKVESQALAEAVRFYGSHLKEELESRELEDEEAVRSFAYLAALLTVAEKFIRAGKGEGEAQ